MRLKLNSNKLILYSWICCYLLTSGFSYAIAQCGEFDWKCKSGECIPAEEKCDGVENCADKSDETADNCLGIQCPAFAFQCTYGACVSGQAKCNGKFECIDHSDESPVLCGKGNTSPNGNCSEGSLQCKYSKECINVEEACDGTKHCRDGSDETLELCSSVKCPAYSFACGYGACVSGHVKCDGIMNCADGSDESLQLCGPDHTTKRPPTVKPPTSPTTPTTNIISRTDNENSPGSCKIVIDDHTEVSPDYDPTVKLSNGDRIEPYRSVLYTCERKYTRFGEGTSYCVDGRLLPPPPKCLRTCNKDVLKSVTFTALCSYKGTEVSCTKNIRPGSRATITCAVGYSRPTTPFYETIVCSEDGEWDYPPARCIEKCGHEAAAVTAFSSGGENTNITSVPWHVAIYRLEATGYQHICGGTIISAKLVVTAAHCFDKHHDWGKYAVVAGKYYRSFSGPDPLETQKINVSSVEIDYRYIGVDDSYKNDIAIIVLNEFIRYRNHIRPICLETDRSYREFNIQVNTTGKIAGWGEVDESHRTTEDLQSVELSVISREDCLAKAGKAYIPFLNNEKFCVGSSYGDSIVCQGDSGGGFVISKNVEGIPTHYLLGVVSAGLGQVSCNLNSYVTFTNVFYHLDSIKESMINYKPK